MSSTIEDRIILVLKEQLTPSEIEEAQAEEGPFATLVKRLSPRQYAGRGFWERLAELSGVTSQRWRSVFTRRQKPTPAMIESVARIWPQYGFWIATGITDATNGHTAPLSALTFPERLYAEDPWSSTYFKMSLRLNEELSAKAGVDLQDDATRMKAVERERPLAHWVGGRLVDTAYELSQSSEYADLIATWEEREKGRKEHIGRIVGSNRPWEKKRQGGEAAGRAASPILGADPRVTHQSNWDLFYRKKDSDDV